jgi:signal peptidase I
MKQLSFSFHSCVVASLLENKHTRLRVIGSSMQPLIQKGDWVIINPYIGDDEPKLGEIVLIDRGVDFVLHRISKINNQEIITKGDWTKEPDPPVNKKQIIGYVTQIEKSMIKIRMSSPITIIFDRILFQFSTLYQSKLKN